MDEFWRQFAPYFEAARFVAALAILAFVIMPRTVDRQK